MDLSQQELKRQLRGFVTSNFYVADSPSLADSASLLDHGIIDSTGVLEVIAFIEKAFDITVDDSEMVADNLDSIERIAGFITRKKAKILEQSGVCGLNVAAGLR